jgi:hypothetical protein
VDLLIDGGVELAKGRSELLLSEMEVDKLLLRALCALGFLFVLKRLTNSDSSLR